MLPPLAEPAPTSLLTFANTFVAPARKNLKPAATYCVLRAAHFGLVAAASTAAASAGSGDVVEASVWPPVRFFTPAKHDNC